MGTLNSEQLSTVLAMWSKAVDVQEHFNDIALRVRNLALTVMTGVLAGVGFAIKESIHVRMFSDDFTLATWVSGIGLLIWLAFYGMDRFWYHRLLVGAVSYGTRLEVVLASHLGIPGGLAQTISEHSGVKVLGVNIRSKWKIDIFYGVGVLILVISAWLGWGHLAGS